MLPMIPFYATVYVKMKKWHKEGGLAAPFVRGRLLCPCPLMSDGWVVELTLMERFCTSGRRFSPTWRRRNYDHFLMKVLMLHFNWRRNHSLEGQRTGW